VDLSFQGTIYPVNPREKKISGIKAYATLQDIPGEIGLVVIAVPAAKVLDIIKDCDKKGVKQLAIVTGGFSEGGMQGQKLHQEIVTFVKEKDMRVIGPNTLSPINTSTNLAISFNPLKEMRQGGISFAFQSGFYDPKINWLFSHLGIHKIIDLGNKMDVNEVDVLEYFFQDPGTKVIAMHIESLHGNGRNFFNLLKKGSIKKPVIILKSGRTPAGSLAAASHTGTIARENDVIFDSMIRQTAAMRARTLDEFFDLAKAFECLMLPKGNRLSIIVLSGGEGVMATDTCNMNGLTMAQLGNHTYQRLKCNMNGLTMAQLGNHTYQRLKSIFPPWKIPLNPLDGGVCLEFTLSDILRVFNALIAIPEDENVDCIVMQMPPDFSNLAPKNENPSAKVSNALKEQYAQAFLNMKRVGKPFALWRTSMDRNEDEFVERLESSCLPVFPSSERAIKALSSLYRYKAFCMRETTDAFLK
jgi:acyl-CoA synthetase (NDP forming)